MTLIIYFFVLMIAALFVGVILFMGFSSHRFQFDFQSLIHGRANTEDLFFWSSISKTDSYAERGRWILFAAVFLIVIELFSFLFYVIYYGGQISMSETANIGWYLGGFLFLIVLIFALVFGARLTSASRDYPGLADGFYPTRKNWEERLRTLNEEQKYQLTHYFIERLNTLERAFVAAVALLASATTLFLVWLSIVLARFVG
ncbi:MAG: hypothetical protein KDK41_12635 [Leptospiraceae bacterium]|nr:hypothetical protein [Leptospiraceae bacterium]